LISTYNFHLFQVFRTLATIWQGQCLHDFLALSPSLVVKDTKVCVRYIKDKTDNSAQITLK
jgi:hypothetical protein